MGKHELGSNFLANNVKAATKKAKSRRTTSRYFWFSSQRRTKNNQGGQQVDLTARITWAIRASNKQKVSLGGQQMVEGFNNNFERI